ncbi:hypothetical protein RIF29_19033 [Crotalaria pallida]|uniref:Uncharacterized protein n=1 Tax=Crotalaria pallida TaxID=3830 RepID=A0AAN9F0J5_CROPI
MPISLFEKTSLSLAMDSATLGTYSSPLRFPQGIFFDTLSDDFKRAFGKSFKRKVTNRIWIKDVVSAAHFVGSYSFREASSNLRLKTEYTLQKSLKQFSQAVSVEDSEIPTTSYRY